MVWISWPIPEKKIIKKFQVKKFNLESLLKMCWRAFHIWILPKIKYSINLLKKSSYIRSNIVKPLICCDQRNLSSWKLKAKRIICQCYCFRLYHICSFIWNFWWFLPYSTILLVYWTINIKFKLNIMFQEFFSLCYAILTILII